MNVKRNNKQHTPNLSEQNRERKYKIEINYKESRRFYSLSELKGKIKRYKNIKGIVIHIYEYPYLPKDEKQPFLFNFL